MVGAVGGSVAVACLMRCRASNAASAIGRRGGSAGGWGDKVSGGCGTAAEPYTLASHGAPTVRSTADAAMTDTTAALACPSSA